MGLATLFRVEGALFLIGVPLALLLTKGQRFITSMQDTLKVYIVPLLGLVIGLAWIGSHPYHRSEYLGRMPELIAQVNHGVIAMIEKVGYRAEILAQDRTLLDVYAMGNATTILVSGLVGIFLLTLLKTASPLYLFLSGCAQYYQWLSLPQRVKNILQVFIIMNVLMLFVFVGQQFFLDRRYLMLLSLLLMLWVPTSLATIYQAWHTRQPTFAGRPWLFPGIVVILLIMAVGGIVRFGHSKAYVTEAGLWIKQHTVQNSKIYSNSPEILFYAERKQSNWDVMQHPIELPFTDPSWKKYDYLAILVKANGQVYSPVEASLLKTFKNKHSDQVMIYQVKR